MQDSKKEERNFLAKKILFCDKHFIALWQNGICLFMVNGIFKKKRHKNTFFSIG